MVRSVAWSCELTFAHQTFIERGFDLLGYHFGSQAAIRQKPPVEEEVHVATVDQKVDEIFCFPRVRRVAWAGCGDADDSLHFSGTGPRHLEPRKPLGGMKRAGAASSTYNL